MKVMCIKYGALAQVIAADRYNKSALLFGPERELAASDRINVRKKTVALRIPAWTRPA